MGKHLSARAILKDTKQLGEMLKAVDLHSQIKDNKIAFLLHADFDGVCIMHILKSLLRAKGYTDEQMIFTFCDNYNFGEVLGQYTGDNPKGITHLIIADIAAITMTDQINELMEKYGVKIAYFEHHNNPKSNEVAEKNSWAWVDDKSNKSSTVQLFLMLLSMLKDNEKPNRGIHEFIDDYLGNVDQATKTFFIEGFEALENQGAKHCMTVLDDILKVSNDNIKDYKPTFGDFVNLSMAVNFLIKAQMSLSTRLCNAANLIDYRRFKEMDGLGNIMDLWDILISKEGVANIDDVLCKIQDYVNALSGSNKSADEINGVKRKIEEEIMLIKEETNFDKRFEESKKGIFKFKMLDQKTKQYINVKAAFSQGDTRFKVQDLGNTEENKNAEIFINFTDVPVGVDAIMTLKPTDQKGSALEFAQNTKKTEAFMEGSKTGIALKFIRESFDKLNRLHLKNVELSSKEMTSKDRQEYKNNIREMEQIMHSELNKYFAKVELNRTEDRMNRGSINFSL